MDVGDVGAQRKHWLATMREGHHLALGVLALALG
jgi:hypothetical protein